jgi:hypothetical protein
MNWKDYFDFLDLKKKKFWFLFWLLIVIHVIIFREYIVGGAPVVCENSFMHCHNMTAIEKSNAQIIEQGNQSEIFLIASQPFMQSSGTVQFDSGFASLINPLIPYIWFECNPCSYGKVRLWFDRILYTPLFLIFYFVIASVLSSLWVWYKMYQVDHPKEEKDSKKEEKK